ncbi:hypothetical protein PybrP1_009314 [[Pythium] brassicae (nom. inval.)]|nr:hypothetical protein PybrP1_009314 [[Pythium] brassicae (nom. inval.)]
MGVRWDVTPAFLALAAALAPDARHTAKQPEPRTELSAFEAEAAELCKSLEAMEALLREVRPRYQRPNLSVRVKGARMSEREKDEFDADFTELVKNCSQKIDALNDDVPHQKEVVTYLFERLKGIADATKRMQKCRFDQPFLLSARYQEVRAELSALEDKLPKAPAAPPQKKAADAPTPPQPERPAADATAATPPSKAPAKPVRPIQSASASASQSDEIEFTEDEDRRFRAENVLLHRHFQENLEDAKRMESTMAEISTLMSQFADKIADQHHDIDTIHQHAKETKSNSNRILEQTQTIGRGYGFLIFCFYAGFSILLHALHYFSN